MKMVIGGACQGKTEYAENLYGKTEWCDGNDCDLEAIFFCDGILHFHAYVKRWMKENENRDAITDLAEKLIRENPEIIIVTDEIGYGLVPIDAFDRVYRENVGRICTKLAAVSERVDRVVCGIGVRIK